MKEHVEFIRLSTKAQINKEKNKNRGSASLPLWPLWIVVELQSLHQQSETDLIYK